MQQAAMRDALLLYTECLKVGKFSQRRWHVPAIDQSVYDFSDSDAPPSVVTAVAAKSDCSRDLELERTTLPKAGISGEVFSSLRRWWTSQRSESRTDRTTAPR